MKLSMSASLDVIPIFIVLFFYSNNINVAFVRASEVEGTPATLGVGSSNLYAL